MSNYPVPPPAYGPAGSPKRANYQAVDDEAREPLLASTSAGGGGIYDQPAQGDLPDDFKVNSPRQVSFLKT